MFTIIIAAKVGIKSCGFAIEYVSFVYMHYVDMYAILSKSIKYNDF